MTKAIYGEGAMNRAAAAAICEANKVQDALQAWGKSVADLRIYAGMTQAQAAEKYKISIPTLAKIEAGESHGVAIETFLRIWQDFGIFNDVAHAGVARDLVHRRGVKHLEKTRYPQAVKTAELMNRGAG